MAPDDLRSRLVCGFVSVLALLVALSGFYKGAQVQDTRELALAADFSHLNAVLRDRSRNCNAELAALRKSPGRAQLEPSVDKLRQENDLLERENELLQQTLTDMKKSNLECEEEMERDRESRTGTREKNATAVVHRLYFEVSQLEAALSGIKEEHQDGTSLMRHKIRALRLENNELRGRVDKLEKDGAGAGEKPQTREDVAAKVLRASGADVDADPQPQQPVRGGSEDAEAPPPPCMDHPDAQHCAEWAALGECTRNAGFMRSRCRKSCGLCASQKPAAECADAGAHCASWAARGECKSNPRYMDRKCPVSCGRCGGERAAAAKEATAAAAAAGSSSSSTTVSNNVAAEASAARVSGVKLFTVRREKGDKIGIQFLGTDVQGVTPDSPAEAAGVKQGMRMVEIDGAAVQSHDDVKTAFVRAGESIAIRVREGAAAAASASRPEPSSSTASAEGIQCGGQTMKVVSGTCRGSRLATSVEALDCTALCASVGRWQMLHLAPTSGHSMKFAGKGYGCKVGRVGIKDDPPVDSLCVLP